MRNFIITVLYKDEEGNSLSSLMDYHFKLFPTYKEIIDAFLLKYDKAKDISIMAIMEFKEEDYKRFVSEK